MYLEEMGPTLAAGTSSSSDESSSLELELSTGGGGGGAAFLDFDDLLYQPKKEKRKETRSKFAHRTTIAPGKSMPQLANLRAAIGDRCYWSRLRLGRLGGGFVFLAHWRNVKV